MDWLSVNSINSEEKFEVELAVSSVNDHMSRTSATIYYPYDPLS